MANSGESSNSQTLPTVDGFPVPNLIHPNQIPLLFPNGVRGLRVTGTHHYVFPNQHGILELSPGVAYHLSNHSGVPSPELSQRVGAAKGSHADFDCLRSANPLVRNDEEQPIIPAPIGRIGTDVPSLENSHSSFPQFPGSSGGVPASPIPHLTGSTNDVQHLQRERSVEQCRVLVDREKIVLDRVHDHVVLPGLIMRIIDTPEFQRLRSLHQLGTCSYLYPGATHTRFEHSIGVSHLAGQMVKNLARRQPELDITSADVLCVMVAGLCHDLGHGPFSHLFENIINRAIKEKNDKREHEAIEQGLSYEPVPKWNHEVMSVTLVRRIMNRLPLERHGLCEEDINFVVLLIDGLRPGEPWPSNVNRPKGKRFLVDIVANKRNGIDVDKLDYFMRDSLSCYGRSSVDCHIPRLLNSCRAISHNGESQICWEEKMALSLGDIFALRARLHKYVYQHHLGKVLDAMVADALLAAEPSFKIYGTQGKEVTITESVHDPEAFIQLGDWLIHAICASPDPTLAKAREIITRIHTRNLYKLVGTAQFATPVNEPTKGEVLAQILNCVEGEEMKDKVAGAIVVDYIKITYGSSDSRGVPDDPINHVTFYNPKDDLNKGFSLPEARHSVLFSPMHYEEKTLFVIVKDPEFEPTVREAFGKWRKFKQRYLASVVPTANSPGRSRKREREEETPARGVLRRPEKNKE